MTRTILSGTLFIFIPGSVVCLFVARLGVRVGRWLENKVAPRLKAMQDEIIASLQVTFDDVPVLNIQTRGDEAAGYLRLIEWIANIPFRVWSPTAIAWVIVVITAVVVTWEILWMLRLAVWRQAPLEAIGGFIFTLIVYLAAVTVVLLVFTMIMQMLCVLWAKLFRGHALGFGEEGFVKNWLAAISSSNQPPGATRNRNETFIVMGGGLHHSLLYEDQAVLESISSWLGAQADKGKTPPNHDIQPTQ